MFKTLFPKLCLSFVVVAAVAVVVVVVVVVIVVVPAVLFVCLFVCLFVFNRVRAKQSTSWTHGSLSVHRLCPSSLKKG